MGGGVWKLLETVLREFESPGGGPRVGGHGQLKGGTINYAFTIKKDCQSNRGLLKHVFLLQNLTYVKFA